jgi:hypothetical protein
LENSGEANQARMSKRAKKNLEKMKEKGLEVESELMAGVKKQKLDKDKFFITNQRSLTQ